MKNTHQQPSSTETRKTAELCGSEYAGARCIKHRGHDGRHECFSRTGEHALRWD